ncbi:hypothetical protein CAPTEDRAFT_224115 [Capitella teleta]|uniref:Uncharacterized protein n=1 Tax=Capitella teleta TaxID=283909 RepID=R7VDR0_CAPTE|nr:hypothetical protein CAPTEDRAFT_224115 [Capitella teleta]|eukprot:ELU16988.1 hypothetical protein CAPTEDRAFT_224115 [Capitella teleta]
MASMLRNAAVKSVNKGQPSAFYPDDKNNPVFMALEQEIKSFVNIMKKRASSPTASKESLSRFADLLFDLWNKYEEKLPKKVFNSKLLEVGHFLFEIKEYNLALWQCYERYIKSFGDVNLDETFDVKSFKKTFFPNGFHAEDTEHTFQALIGRSACSYERIKLMDPKLQNSHSVDHSVIILKFLRLMTQVILPTEKLCWLVYNGTIRIYQISRHLMTKGHSSKVLEFLLWASMCMETSLPLLGVHYLKWRVTLYASVCQCYYDCKAGVHAEAFARRAVSKINELSQLESLSSNPESKEVEEAFRQATIKMAIMIYKRTVYETRRKPKGLLRPKTRANLKDAVQLPWPRTQSERLLSEMFEGGSAQMLCLLETITDSNRRTLLSNPPAAENEVELLDVFAELFLAAQELIAGGGGSQSQLSGSYYLPLSVNIPRFGGVCKEIPMMQLATQGEDGVPLSVVVKVVKLAYCYEQWDVFDTLLPNTLSVIKEINSPTYDSDLKALELLQAYDKVVPRAKQRCLFGNDEEEEEGLSTEAPAHDKGQRSNNGMQDDLIEFAEVLLSVINGPLTQDQFDNDMMVDATLFLWSKCKAIFQKFQTGSTDNPKYLQKMDNPGKWVYLLDIVHQALSWSGLSSIDPALTAEVVLRLSLVFEASSLLEMKGIVKSGANSPSKGPEDEETTIISTVKDAGTAQGTARELSTSQSELSTSHCGGSQQSIFSATALSQGVLEQLQQARSILESGLDNVSLARTVVALTDGKSITDVIWVKEFNTDLFAPVIPTEDEVLTDSEAEECLEAVDGTAVWNTVRDLHMELLFMYHRICLKLINLGSRGKDKGCQSKNLASSPHASQRRLGNKTPTESYEDLMKNARCNGLSKALLLMQRAMEVHMTSRGAGSQEEILREAIHILRRVEAEEKRLYLDNFKDDQSRSPSKLPPSPILLCRTEVAWYRIFARNAAGSNVKVRMSDYTFPGTGEQTPSFNCEFEIRGLTPGEQYMFAVAAYTADGQLIGKGIGDSTLPILASHPMPVLMAWAFLSQLSYQVGCVEICESACRVLWAHFVAEPPPSQGITYTTSTRKDFKLTLHKLNQRVVTKTSPVLLRLFLTSIFIRVDIAVRRGQLFCTKLCDEGPLHQAQIARLKQCEIMLVAMQLAGWMNENNLALQAAVQCYGLLAPLLHYKIPCVAITQVLERCCAVLLEVPSHIRVKRTAVISEGLHHMTACLTFNMAKVMRGWGQRSLASHLNDCGRRLLAQDSSAAREAMTTEGGDAITETGSLTLAALKKRKGKKGGLVSGKEECFSTGNEELKALEAHMLRLSKQAQGEHELSGNEDPSILHAYIAYLPGRIAFKEVVKFKRRARYLEFFTQCVQKTLSEGTYDLALEWCEETTQWLIKRNENIIGTRTTIGKQPGAMTLIGDDPKKFQAALVEYSKEKPCNLLPNLDPKLVKALESPASKEKLRTAGVSEKSKPRSKKTKYKAIAVTNLMSDAQRQAQEELEIRLNLVKALSQFGVFMKRLEIREKMIGGHAATYLYRTSFLEEDWFSFETTGTLIVNWSGGPSRQATRQGQRSDKMSEATMHEEKASGIEIAAAAATGVLLEMTESPRTKEASKGTGSPGRQNVGKGRKKGKEEEVMVTREEGVEMLKRTFTFFKKAIILAHRGHHWMLLQNVCRALWNCAQTALSRAHSPNKNGIGTFLEVSMVRTLLWQPLYCAADCLLDMMVQLQQTRSKREPIKDAVRSWMGAAKDERGGANLKFEADLDDLSTVDVRWVRRITLRVLELLHHQQKWERLVDLSLRFNALSE